MAKQTVLIDDLDGGKADETIAFVIDGHAYSLDLSRRNADRFRKALAPFIEAACRSEEARRSQFDSEDSAISQRAAIRAWAKSAGLDVAERGRIPQDILDAYRNR